MRSYYFGFMLLAGLTLWSGCQQDNPNFQAEAANPEYYHRSVKKLTDVIVHDIFSPPVASRIYTYATVAGYEAMAPSDPSYRSLAGQLNELKDLPQPEPGVEYCFPLASVHAFLTVGRSMIFSEEKIQEFQDELYAEFDAVGIPEEVFERSLAYGDAVAQHIKDWSSTDNYKQTRTFPKYSISRDQARWQPTPPGYMDGIEPHWNKIRPFALTGADQFTPAPPTPFSPDKNSQFYQEAMEVYEAVNAADAEERTAIAQFWDCNPYVSHHQGHVMFATKKITPGGHWVNIAGLAARQAEADYLQTTEAYVMTSVAMADAFISCWDEKYRSNLVRPETYINQYIDPEWLPLLQTPPFPEHTSGHSVCSRACAIVLTQLFGDNFGFNDTTEEEFGLPARSFTSFLQASEEAAMSRLYGGIHYRPAIDEGLKQGEKVGRHVLERVQTRTHITQR